MRPDRRALIMMIPVRIFSLQHDSNFPSWVFFLIHTRHGLLKTRFFLACFPSNTMPSWLFSFKHDTSLVIFAYTRPLSSSFVPPSSVFRHDVIIIFIWKTIKKENFKILGEIHINPSNSLSSSLQPPIIRSPCRSMLHNPDFVD